MTAGLSILQVLLAKECVCSNTLDVYVCIVLCAV